jgi:hypothetical protein
MMNLYRQPGVSNTEGTERTENFRTGLDTFKKGNKSTYLISIVIIIVVIIISLAKNTGSMDQQLGSEYLGVLNSKGEAVFVFYSDITAVEARDTLDRGTLKSGTETRNVWSGTYINNEFGEYTLNAYVRVDEFIVIKYKDKVLVLNCGTKKDTDKMYKELLEFTKPR